MIQNYRPRSAWQVGKTWVLKFFFYNLSSFFPPSLQKFTKGRLAFEACNHTNKEKWRKVIVPEMMSTDESGEDDEGKAVVLVKHLQSRSEMYERGVDLEVEGVRYIEMHRRSAAYVLGPPPSRGRYLELEGGVNACHVEYVYES